MIQITQTLSIPEEELEFVASRSSGPGGQNVNKVNSRVTLRFDVDGSPSLDERQRERLRERLASRISRQGVLAISAQDERSQAANRSLVTERFVELLRGALAEQRPRRPTRPSAASRRRRLDDKRRRSRLKQDRSGGWEKG